jgi:hypothetical protein
MMVTVQLAMLTTTMKMATARWDTTTTTMTTDINNDDDDEGDDASWTGCDEVDNHNRDDSKDACASMADGNYHAAGEGNGSILVGMFVSLCLASKKSSEREFFVPAGTLIGVKLLTIYMKPRHSALGQSLWMAAQMSDRGDSFN